MFVVFCLFDTFRPYLLPFLDFFAALLRLMNSDAKEETAGVEPKNSRMYSRMSEEVVNVMQK